MTIAITPGEPAGIGPDLLLQVAHTHPTLPLIAIADRDMLAKRADMLGLGAALDSLQIQHVPMATAVQPGKPSPENTAYLLETLNQAVSGCQQQRFSAMVTGPINKAVMNQTAPFSGHTEYLAKRTDSPRPVMMLLTGQLRVALVTTHLPLAQVPRAITRDNVIETVQITHQALQNRFGIANPRISVCGLNPHAGEKWPPWL